MAKLVLKKSTSPSDKLDEDSIHLLRNLFYKNGVKERLEQGGNLPMVDGWIELLDSDDVMEAKITVQVKHLTYPAKSSDAFYDIPNSVFAYASLNKGDVVIFIACDTDNETFYWRYIDTLAIQEFVNIPKENQLTQRYHFKEFEACKKENVSQTISIWKNIYKEKMSSIQDEKALAEKFALAHRSAFFLIQPMFFGIPESHIARNEVIDLLNWIKEPITETHGNICFLQGKAGVGKSVVIKDLIDELDKQKIKTLCVKADSLNMMSDDLKFDKLLNYVQYLKAGQHMLVFVIDQIDALSQYLTNDREKINLFVTLLSKLRNDQNVKIVVSCRKYDLEYDNELNLLCRNAKLIDLGKLEEKDVKKIIDLLSEGLYNQLNVQTVQLLQTAHLLNLFCIIYHRRGRTVNFKNAHQLYDEFWRLLLDNVPSKIDKLIVEGVLYKIAKFALDQKTLSPVLSLDNDESTILDYLYSNNAIIKNGDSCSFFHQSFYDYSLARLYTQRGGSFFDEIQNEFQGFEIRSSVKAVLEYERNHNLEQYSSDLQLIFHSPKIRRHIKLLTLSLIAMQEDICDCERKIIPSVCSIEPKFLSFFLRGIGHERWFISLRSVVLPLVDTLDRQSELLYPISNFLSCASFKHPKEVFDVISHTKDGNVRTYITHYVLRAHNDYRRTRVCEALLNSTLDYHFLIDALIDAMQTNPQFVFKETEKLVMGYLLSEDDNRRDGYPLVEKLCKKMATDFPEEYTFMFHRCFLEIIDKGSKPHYLQGLTLNDVFGHHIDEYESKLFRLYKKLLVKFSSNDIRIKSLVKDLYDTNNECAVSLAFEIMSLNPSLYDKEVQNIIEDSCKIDLYLQGDVEYYFLILLRNWYLILCPYRKSIYESLVLNYKSQDDRITKKQLNYYKTAFPLLEKKKWKLISVTIPCNTDNVKINRYRLVLNRRFYNMPYTLEKPSHGARVAEVCGGSLSKEKFAKLSLKRWLDLFAIDERLHNDRKPVDIRVNAEQFKICVSNRPDRFLTFVFNMFANESIKQIYRIAGIKGLLEGGVCLDDIWPYVKTFMNNDFVKSYVHDFSSIIQHYLQFDNIHIDELVVFLKSIAILPNEDERLYTSVPGSDELESRVNYQLTKALNSHQGRCVDLLLKLCGIEQRRSLGYKLLKEIEPLISEDLRLLVVYKIFDQKYYDQELTYAIFGHYIKRLGSEALYLCTHAIQYCFYHKYEIVGDYIERIETDNNTHKVLAEIYFYGLAEQDTFDLCNCRLERMLALNEEDVVADIVKICLKNHRYADHQYLCEKYLRRFSNDGREDVIHSYCWYAKELSIEAFDLFVEVYSCFKANKFRDVSDELKYIKKCIIEYPQECLEFLQTQKYEDMELPHLIDEEIHELLLMIYKRLNEDHDIDTMNLLMNTFEELICNCNSAVLNKIIFLK